MAAYMHLCQCSMQELVNCISRAAFNMSRMCRHWHIKLQCAQSSLHRDHRLSDGHVTMWVDHASTK